jgi:hypothetical protein
MIQAQLPWDSKEKTVVALPGNRTALPNTQRANQTQIGAVGASARPDIKAMSGRFTATEVQVLKLIELLRLAPRHTHELRKLGISHPAGRINDLQKRGFLIASGRVTTVDSDGFSHAGVARYSINSEPEGGAE